MERDDDTTTAGVWRPAGADGQPLGRHARAAAERMAEASPDAARLALDMRRRVALEWVRRMLDDGPDPAAPAGEWRRIPPTFEWAPGERIHDAAAFLSDARDALGCPVSPRGEAGPFSAVLSATTQRVARCAAAWGRHPLASVPFQFSRPNPTAAPDLPSPHTPAPDGHPHV